MRCHLRCTAKIGALAPHDSFSSCKPLVLVGTPGWRSHLSGLLHFNLELHPGMNATLKAVYPFV